MDYSLDRLPPFRKGTSNLFALPHNWAIPCVRVPADMDAMCFEAGEHIGAFGATEGDWHIMPDLATHLCVPQHTVRVSGSVWDKVKGLARRDTPIFDIKPMSTNPRNDEAIRAWWAALGHPVTPCGAIRKRPAKIIGQVTGLRRSHDNLLELGDAWYDLFNDDWIVAESDAQAENGLVCIRVVRGGLMWKQFRGWASGEPSPKNPRLVTPFGWDVHPNEPLINAR